MDFNVILLMLLPICSAILWLFSSVPALNKIWSAISWQCSAPDDIRYIQREHERMQAFLEKAEGDPETAKNKRELISQVRELASDAEYCIDEFKRLLDQPTDQEIFRCLLRSGILLRDGTGTWFLKIRTWLLGTSAGILFCGVVTCAFLGIGTCVGFLRIVLKLGTPLLISTAVELHDSLLWTGPKLGFPLLIRTSLDPMLRTGHLHLTDHEIVGLFLRIGDLLWSTGAVTCFLKISTCFLVIKISTCFLRTQLQRLCTSFLRSARARFLRIGLELRTCFERDTYWLRTGVEFSTHFLRKVHAQYRIKIEVQRIKAGVEQEHMRELRYNVIAKASNAPAGRLLEQYRPSRRNAHFTQDAELVGINEPRDKLLNLLLVGNEEQRCVISVVGCGVLRKTTLVRKIFESQRLNIDGVSFGRIACCAWITVSAPFELIGFLNKMFQKLSLDGFNTEFDVEQLISKIRGYLQDKRYVIVFDDVCTEDVWEDIKNLFFVKNKEFKVVGKKIRRISITIESKLEEPVRVEHDAAAEKWWSILQKEKWWSILQEEETERAAGVAERDVAEAKRKAVEADQVTVAKGKGIAVPAVKPVGKRRLRFAPDTAAAGVRRRFTWLRGDFQGPYLFSSPREARVEARRDRGGDREETGVDESDVFAAGHREVASLHTSNSMLDSSASLFTSTNIYEAGSNINCPNRDPNSDLSLDRDKLLMGQRAHEDISIHVGALNKDKLLTGQWANDDFLKINVGSCSGAGQRAHDGFSRIKVGSSNGAALDSNTGQAPEQINTGPLLEFFAKLREMGFQICDQTMAAIKQLSLLSAMQGFERDLMKAAMVKLMENIVDNIVCGESSKRSPRPRRRQPSRRSKRLCEKQQETDIRIELLSLALAQIVADEDKEKRVVHLEDELVAPEDLVTDHEAVERGEI